MFERKPKAKGKEKEKRLKVYGLRTVLMERRDRALKACTASSAMLTNYRSKEM